MMEDSSACLNTKFINKKKYFFDLHKRTLKNKN